MLLGFRSTLLSSFSPAALFAAGEQGVWYDPSDMTTLFQDSAGTTPVTAVEQPVGLMLDKSKGLTFSNGLKRVNLLTWTEAFNDAAWVLFGGATKTGTNVATAPDGTLTADSVQLTTAGTGSNVYQQFSANAGTYIFSCYVKRNAVTDQTFQLFQNIGGTQTSSGNFTATDTWQQFTLTATGITGTSVFGIIGNTGGVTSNILVWGADLRLSSEASTVPTPYQRIDASWSATMPGNHATQATPSARPVLSARVNLLTKTEQFNDAVWANSNTTETTTIATTAPNGTNTAYKLIVDNGSQSSAGIAQVFNIVSGTSYKFSVYVKAAEKTFALIQLDGDLWQNAPSTDRPRAWVNLSTGSISSTQRVIASSISPVGNGWYQVSISATASSTTATTGRIAVTDANGSFACVGNGTDGIYIWGADLRVANDTALPVYQRVDTSTSYDTTGFPMYLRFDGSDDRLSLSGTGLDILKNVNAAVIFSGVRYTGATSGYQTIFEADINIASDRSALYIKSTTAFEAGGRRLDADSYQGLEITSVDMTQQNVLTANFDYANAQLYARRNGVQYQRGGGFQTAGNTSNTASNAITIASTGAGGQWFNGRIYSLIVRGAATSDTLIEQTENWISGEMGGGYYPTGFDFLVDANGDQITDASGNPIITQAYY